MATLPRDINAARDVRKSACPAEAIALADQLMLYGARLADV